MCGTYFYTYGSSVEGRPVYVQFMYGEKSTLTWSHTQRYISQINWDKPERASLLSWLSFHVCVCLSYMLVLALIHNNYIQIQLCEFTNILYQVHNAQIMLKICRVLRLVRAHLTMLCTHLVIVLLHSLLDLSNNV